MGTEGARQEAARLRASFAKLPALIGSLSPEARKLIAQHVNRHIDEEIRSKAKVKPVEVPVPLLSRRARGSEVVPSPARVAQQLRAALKRDFQRVLQQSKLRETPEAYAAFSLTVGKFYAQYLNRRMAVLRRKEKLLAAVFGTAKQGEVELRDAVSLFPVVPFHNIEPKVSTHAHPQAGKGILADAHRAIADHLNAYRTPHAVAAGRFFKRK